MHSPFIALTSTVVMRKHIYVDDVNNSNRDFALGFEKPICLLVTVQEKCMTLTVLQSPSE